MSQSQLGWTADLPSDSVVVIDPTSWANRSAELGRLLAIMAGSEGVTRVVPGRNGSQQEGLAKISTPSYWAGHSAVLGDALAGAVAEGASPAGAALSSGAGAVAESPDRRLTWTVEEAASALGISRAFAYDAVRRGEIPAIKIGRRILVPRTALIRLLEHPQEGFPALDSEGPGG